MKLVLFLINCVNKSTHINSLTSDLAHDSVFDIGRARQVSLRTVSVLGNAARWLT